MKIHLYLVCDFAGIGADSQTVFEQSSIMTEKDLREHFKWARDQNCFPLALLNDYKQDPDYAKENWEDLNSLSIGTIVDMFNDIVNYDGRDCAYYILEHDIEVEK